MNVNVWSIKDLFSIPSAMGPNKASSWTSTPNDHNSMSDSQFLLGSQFCPENSQSVLAPLEFSIPRQGKSSQQNSQDQNESSIFAKYQSKPQLFGGDGKEKTSLNFSTGGFQGVLEQFEENKKKIKEKLDRIMASGLDAFSRGLDISEVLNNFALNTSENLQKVQSSLDNFEKTLKFILDGMEILSKTSSCILPSHHVLQCHLHIMDKGPNPNLLSSKDIAVLVGHVLHQDGYQSQKPPQVQETSQSHGLILNALNNKNEMEQTLLRMEKSLDDKDKEISDLKSSLQLLKETLDQLTAQQNEQHQKLCEHLDHLQIPSLLAELQTFISAPRLPSHIKDSASQTSPGILLAQQPYNSRQSILDVLPGSQVISTFIASEGQENANIQQRNHIPTTGHDSDSPHCNSCFSTSVPKGSHGGCWLLTQDPSQATPMRKVIKRENREKGLSAMRHIRLNQTHVDNGLIKNHADDQKKLATNSKVQTRSVGKRRSQNEKAKKCSPRKKVPSPRKKGRYSRCTSTNLKQKVTKRGSKEVKLLPETSQYPYRERRNPDNSSWGSLIVNQPKPCQTQNRKTKKSKFGIQTRENIQQHVLNQKEMSQIARSVNLSSEEKNNCFWAYSSPETALSSNQMKWFSLSENSFTCATLTKKTTTTCCPLFFDSDYSD